MKSIDPFKIATIALSNKKHHYEIESNADFFSRYEQDIVDKGQFTVFVDLDKSETMIQVHLKIQGHLSLVCDRSLEEFEEPLDISQKLIFKYGDHFEDLGDNLYQLDRKNPTIDLFQDIFDFIALEVPMKKLHPRFRADEDPEQEGILLYSTLDDLEEEEEENEIDNQDPNQEIDEDSPWKDLKKLINKDKNSN